MTLSPIIRLALGLVGAIVGAFVLADLAFNLLPNNDAQTRSIRAAIAEIATLQIVEKLSDQQGTQSIERILDSIRQRFPDLKAVAVRDQTGGLVMSSGAGLGGAAPAAAEGSPERVIVPIHFAQSRWGEAEFLFPAVHASSVAAWLAES